MSSPFMERLKEFIATHMTGQDAQFDSLSNTPLPLCQAFRAHGMANWWIPKQYGGIGLSLSETVDIVEELAYADAGVAFTLFISIVPSTVLAIAGTEAQKERFLAPMVKSGAFVATLASERAAGSE